MNLIRQIEVIKTELQEMRNTIGDKNFPGSD